MVIKTPPPPVQRLHGGRPLIERHAGHPWESRVTFNPACAIVRDRASLNRNIDRLPFSAELREELRAHRSLVFILYRAQGDPAPDHDFSHSSLGLAVCSEQLDLLARYDRPVLAPEEPYENLGVEDGRLTQVDDTYLLFYTAYAAGSGGNAIRIAIAGTKDFVTWQKHGLLRGDLNRIHNKNAMLFEGRPGGSFLLLHRPMEGKDALAVHWAESADIFGEWKTRGLLMAPLPNAEFVDTWIGGGAPPMRLADGRYLMLYHIGNRRADRSREYDLGLALLDLSHPDIVVKRSEPLVRPETPAELTGDPRLGLGNVLFVCGAYWSGDDLVFPYAGADSVVLGAKITGGDLRSWIG